MQTQPEGTNKYAEDNSVYPVLETFQEGSVVEMKVVMSTYHWVSGGLLHVLYGVVQFSFPSHGSALQFAVWYGRHGAITRCLLREGCEIFSVPSEVTSVTFACSSFCG